jgi:Secretion system C-terminal sorting domain
MFIRIILLIITFLPSSTTAQQKHSLKWGIGLSKTIVDFNNDIDSLQFTYMGVHTDPKTIMYKGISSICDSTGKFLFMTDGFRVYNWLGDTLPGGGGRLNNECYTKMYNNISPVHQSTLILPKGSNSYYLFNATFGDNQCQYINNQWVFPDSFRYNELRYSIINVDTITGLPFIAKHNVLASSIQTNPYWSVTNFTATRHANGRDWWLLKPGNERKENLYSWLVTENSIEEMPIQYFPTPQLSLTFVTYVGQSTFSKDGSLYAQCNVNHRIQIFNFDRCSGIANIKDIIRTDTLADKFIGGVCFSPNNRFLYFVNSYNVYQYDLEEPDPSLALMLVSETDTSANFPDYSGMQLTPTGHIWLGHWNGISKDINAIMKPNEKGKACAFKFDYARLLSNTNEPPNLVHYGLGALDGSVCDTIKPLFSIHNSWQLYPNPNNGTFKVRVPINNATKVHAIIYNNLGQKVQQLVSEVGYKYEANFKFNLASGLYLARFVSGDKVYFTKISIW